MCVCRLEIAERTDGQDGTFRDKCTSVSGDGPEITNVTNAVIYSKDLTWLAGATNTANDRTHMMWLATATNTTDDGKDVAWLASATNISKNKGDRM